jgi:hypothetical protein
MSCFKLSALLVLVTALVSGCATQVTETPSKVTPATTDLGEFSQVILVKTEIAPTYASHPANLKAVKKIDEILAERLGGVLENVQVKTLDQIKSENLANNGNVLFIKPYVKQIKFIGGAARFWAGAMAGSSVVIMDVAFEDGANGTKLSNPGFMRKAGAYTDAFGVASNAMLDDVAQDVVNYVAANK